MDLLHLVLLGHVVAMVVVEAGPNLNQLLGQSLDLYRGPYLDLTLGQTLNHTQGPFLGPSLGHTLNQTLDHTPNPSLLVVRLHLGDESL